MPYSCRISGYSDCMLNLVNLGRPSTRLRRSLPFVLSVVLFATSKCLLAQAAPAASRSLDVIVFAEYERLSPDYGPSLNGLTAGLDIGHPIHIRWILPALEIRANYAGETVAVGEESVAGGLKLGLNLVSSPRIRPYVNFLVGAGQINFNNAPPYTKDNSVLYQYGAGIDYEIVANFALRAEFQHQNWDLGRLLQGKDSLTPSAFNLGLSYRIPSFHRK